MTQAQEKDFALTGSAGRSLRVVAAAFALLLLVAVSIEAQTIGLERGWQLLLDREGALKAEEVKSAQGWRDVRVGLSWNAQFSDLRDYMGVAWYRTSFDLARTDSPRHLLLRFDAVDYFSEVYLNGKRIGEHEGGYTPFSFDVTEAARPGANELIVRVIDPPMDEKENRARFPALLYNEIPHGKQNWYVQTGGIWQPVTLELKPETYLERVRVETKLDGEIRARVSLAGLQAATESLDVRVLDPSGTDYKLTFAGGGSDESGSHLATFTGRVNRPRPWSPDHPSLYTIQVRTSTETYTDRFGFRTFEARDGKFYLNGEPFYLIGALDQDFYPETIYTPPSVEFVRDEMLKAKQLGLNTLRCHIKVCDPTYLRVADEVGLLVWYEIPSWNDFNHFTPKAAERGEKIFAEQVERDWNHPSIVIQSIINESWGADLKQAEQRAWLRAAFERAKRLTAPLGRLIVDNSACCENFHLTSDIADFHQYFSIPDHYSDWDRWVADFARRPAWLFSRYGDGAPTGREPLVVSEFGNWGLPKLPKNLPWWFERDFGGREVTRPAGVFDRFRDFKFARLFRDYDELAVESQWHQFISLKHEIEEMRRHASVQGYVITEFTDINWEVNGLLDMWRNPKAYAAELAKIQQPDVIVGRAARRSYTSGERVEIETLVSHYSGVDLNGATVNWSTESGARGQFKLGRAVRQASVTPLETISFNAANVQQPRREKVSLALSSAKGQRIAVNSYEIFLFPKAQRAATASLIFYDPANSSAKLSQALMTAGYKVSVFKHGSFDGQSLLLATRIDDEVKRHLQSGGQALVLADSADAIPAGSPLKVAARAGSDLDGNWVTNFNWARTDAAPFNEVALTRILGFEAAAAVPRFVIQGVRAADYDDVSAGIFYGWLNNNAALALGARAGRGRLFLTTFRFEAYGSDAYTTRLLDAMIRHASGPDFNPKLTWPL